MDIEEDIKRCEKLTKPQNANWIGRSNQKAIENILADRERLEAENNMMRKVDKIVGKISTDKILNALKEADKLYIPKQTIKDKIDELNIEYKKQQEQHLADYHDWIRYTAKVTVLQELLEGSDK